MPFNERRTRIPVHSSFCRQKDLPGDEDSKDLKPSRRGRGEGATRSELLRTGTREVEGRTTHEYFDFVIVSPRSSAQNRP